MGTETYKPGEDELEIDLTQIAMLIWHYLWLIALCGVVAAAVGAVPRTSTIALTNATLRYGHQIAEAGLDEACRKSPVIASGVNCYRGNLTNQKVAEAHGYDWTDLGELIASACHFEK